MINNKLKGIYPITPNHICSDNEYLEKCFLVINSGIKIFQFRSTSISSRKKRYLLNEIYKYCDNSEVQLIINNDYHLVKYYEGAGVHIGKNDIKLQNIKKNLGSNTIVGYSCGAKDYSLKELKDSGVTYFSLGAVYPSKTKLITDSLTDNIIKKYNKIKSIPMCLIGGIDENNINSVVTYKPDMIAISNGIFKQDVDNIKKTMSILKGFINEKD
jgi:thiamine-phosphate pyrophosphorylase